MAMGRSDYDQTNAGTFNYTDNLVAGADVYGSDNEKIGTVADVGQNYFLVQKGWLFIKDLYLPTSAIMQADGNNIYLGITKQQAEQMGRDELPGTGDAWYGTQCTGAAMTDAGYATDRTIERTDMTTDREVGREVRGNENISVPAVEDSSNPRVHVEGERGMTGRTDTTSDTVYDRTSMAGDRHETDRRGGEGIIDRAKDALHNEEDKFKNR